MRKLLFALAVVLTLFAALTGDREAAAINVPSTGCMAQGITNTLTAAINNAGSSSNLQVIAHTTGKSTYICAINVGPVSGATNVALVYGTQTTNPCDTGTTGMAGGATAATGWQFAANGGLTMGDGQGLIAKAAASKDVCLLFSAGNQVSGTITWAQF